MNMGLYDSRQGHSLLFHKKKKKKTLLTSFNYFNVNA